MARYFFTTANGAEHGDPDGTELPDDVAARAAALRTFGELLRDGDDLLRSEHLLLTVTRDDGATMWEFEGLMRSPARDAGLAAI